MSLKSIEKQLPPFLTDKETVVGRVTSDIIEFAHDSIRFVRGCKRPDEKEFKQIAFACAIGFAIMGFIGYFVKLVFIPINNILVGSH